LHFFSIAFLSLLEIPENLGFFGLFSEVYFTGISCNCRSRAFE
jgi:hypothetical protein